MQEIQHAESIWSRNDGLKHFHAVQVMSLQWFHRRWEHVGTCSNTYKSLCSWFSGSLCQSQWVFWCLRTGCNVRCLGEQKVQQVSKDWRRFRGFRRWVQSLIGGQSWCNFPGGKEKDNLAGLHKRWMCCLIEINWATKLECYKSRYVYLFYPFPLFVVLLTRLVCEESKDPLASPSAHVGAGMQTMPSAITNWTCDI